MRIVLFFVKLYLAIGLVFGSLLFASMTLHAAMSLPDESELAGDALSAAVDGLVRVVTWAPSLATRVGQEGESPLEWFLYAEPRTAQI